jgi:Neutral trehalase
MAPDSSRAAQIAALETYIRETWPKLTRSVQTLCQSATDPKTGERPGSPHILYLSPRENEQAVEGRLRECMSAEDFARIEIRPIPGNPWDNDDHGLLYLPGEYVVPGGRFNEMYGWDSYFINLGLLREGRIDLAKSMVDQQLYEIEHYGMVLNANRSYYLTRSHPPVLGMMLFDVFSYTKDLEWLGGALPLAEQYHTYYMVPPHRDQASGLSRYFDVGRGTAPEVLYGERDENGRGHYDRLREFFRDNYPAIDDVEIFYDRTRDALTEYALKGDRSMRESGFDPSGRFGPFNLDAPRYAPVCLNTLLYVFERNLAEMNRLIGDMGAANYWENEASLRVELINRFLWDEKTGLYLDYHLENFERARYPFLTTFWPLWARIASKEQAARVMENLCYFEVDGGLQTSYCATGNQWDAPFIWAPLQLFAIEGMRHYGYCAEADRIQRKFMTLVLDDFTATGGLFEKYKSCGSRSVADDLRFGYTTNEPGFGWTNGVMLELFHQDGIFARGNGTMSA